MPDATDLHVLAQAAGISFEQFHELNPELRRFCTPPGGWTIKLPKGSKDAFVANYAQLDARDRLSFTEHKVEKGEPIGKIARAYGVSEAAILRTNGIKSYRQIKPGRMLVIPMSSSAHGLLAGSQLEDGRRHGRVQARVASATMVSVQPRAGNAFYKVRPGDTLWNIASKFSTTVEKLRKLNGLTGHRARALQAGQTIAVRDS